MKTDKKNEFYRLLGTGLTQKEIAIKLGITEKTATRWKRDKEKPLKGLEMAKAKLLERLIKACDSPNVAHNELYDISRSISIIDKQIQAKRA